MVFLALPPGIAGRVKKDACQSPVSDAFPLAIIAMTNVISKWLNGCIMGSSVSLSLVQFSPACGAVFIVVASFSISLRRTA